MSYIEINKAVSQWLLTFNLCVSVTWPLTCAFHIPCTHIPEIIDMHRGVCDNVRYSTINHPDDVIKWKYFPVNSPHKGQWHGALMFSFICVWINGWVNNREAGDWRRYRAHYDVTVMIPPGCFTSEVILQNMYTVDRYPATKNHHNARNVWKCLCVYSTFIIFELLSLCLASRHTGISSQTLFYKSKIALIARPGKAFILDGKPPKIAYGVLTHSIQNRGPKLADSKSKQTHQNRALLCEFLVKVMENRGLQLFIFWNGERKPYFKTNRPRSEIIHNNVKAWTWIWTHNIQFAIMVEL